MTEFPRRALSPAEFCRVYGLGLTRLYSEISAGRLIARKSGRRTIILAEDARKWEASLPAMHADAVLG